MSAPVVIIVPCYNESGRLPVKQLQAFLDSSRVEFVFVDDGSRDKTRELLETLRNGREDRVAVLAMQTNRGKAEAVRQGVLYALQRGAGYVGFWDADLATPLETIRNFMDVFQSRPGLDMVFGSRVKLLGRRIERRAARHYAGRVFATVVSIVLRLPIYDTQCGAKIFRVTPGMPELFAEPFLSRWVFDVELIARYVVRCGSAGRAAASIYEYPLEAWTDVQGSRLKAMDFGIAFWDVVRIYWKYRRDLRA